ncbi:ABC transporter substrate-binding protein [Thermoanaerobacterium thermosaccharolyticum]|uniref:sugar ABC transporter substrate-binding protein n=1 Tax=Thermoanaerobacterium thermosaccharolyticum TaxID=1517 RepID=UPI002FDA7A07
MFKRSFLYFLTFIFSVSVLLTGCGNTSSKKTNSNVQQGKVELTMWHYFAQSNQQKALKEIGDAFSKSKDGKVTIKFQYIPFAQLKQQITIGATGSNLPDLVQIDSPDHASFASMGILEDLTPEIEQWGQVKKFFDGPIHSVMLDGKYYGLPLDSNCLVLFYNVKMFKNAGLSKPPATWSELEDYAKKLTKGDIKGLAFSAIKSEESTFQFLPFVWQAGADYNNLDSKGGIEALSFWTDLVKNGYVSKDVLNQTQGDIVTAQFASEKVAMMINGPYEILTIEQAAPDFKANEDWKVAPLPTYKTAASALGGENIAVIKSSKHKDLAWEFIKFFEQPQIAEKWYKEAGYLPSRKDVAETSSYWKDDPILSVLSEEMNVARPRGPEPRWPEISTAIQEAIQEALTGTASPEQALKNASEQINKVINKK